MLATGTVAAAGAVILELPGHGACLPDLTFQHTQISERVHLEE